MELTFQSGEANNTPVNNATKEALWESDKFYVKTKYCCVGKGVRDEVEVGAEFLASGQGRPEVVTIEL